MCLLFTQDHFIFNPFGQSAVSGWRRQTEQVGQRSFVFRQGQIALMFRFDHVEQQTGEQVLRRFLEEGCAAVVLGRLRIHDGSDVFHIFVGIDGIASNVGTGIPTM